MLTAAEMDMGWVHQWVRLGWVGSGRHFGNCHGLLWVGFNETVLGLVQRLREMKTTRMALHFIPRTLNWQKKFNRNYYI